MTDANPNKRRFVRVYYVDLKRDYPDVWYGPTCLSTWLRLLAIADETFPSMPELPTAMRRADLEQLTGCGLIELQDNRRFTIKGYQKERGARQELARKAAGARHHPQGSDDAAA